MKIRPLESFGRVQDDRLRQEGYRTFNGWVRQGRHVKKGEHATRFNSHNKPLFHERQTQVMTGAGQFDMEDLLAENWGIDWKEVYGFYD